MRDNPVTPAISGLLRACGPAHVSRFVIAVVVWKAVECVLGGWPQPHICQEVFEGSGPAAAYCNSPATITGKRRSLGICASLLHRLPCFVFWSFALSLYLPTSASGAAWVERIAFKRSASDDAFFAANFAQAVPQGVPESAFAGVTDDKVIGVFLADEVLEVESGIGRNRLSISHGLCLHQLVLFRRTFWTASKPTSREAVAAGNARCAALALHVPDILVPLAEEGALAIAKNGELLPGVDGLTMMLSHGMILSSQGRLWSGPHECAIHSRGSLIIRSARGPIQSRRFL